MKVGEAMLDSTPEDPRQRRPRLYAALDLDLLAQVQDVLAGSPTNEVDLRRVSERAAVWRRTLQGQLDSSEERLDALIEDASSPLAAIADELRRIERLGPALSELRRQLEALERRARELRRRRLVEQAVSRSGPRG
jgi:chromosome segregation ATPase